MLLIDHFKNTWSRNVTTKDRFQFSLVLLLLMIFFYYSNYMKVRIPFVEYQWEVYTIIGFLTSFIVIDFWGNFIVRIWLTVAGLVGKIIFLLLTILVYYLILTPIFVLANLRRKKSVPMSTNWSNKVYSNKDYQKMG